MVQDFVWAVDDKGKPSMCRAKLENRGKRNCKHRFHNDDNLDPDAFFKQCSESLVIEKRRSIVDRIENGRLDDCIEAIEEAKEQEDFPFANYIHHRHAYVRRAVAQQGYGLDVLVNDNDWWVREAVAYKGYGLEQLVSDENCMVRAAVALQGYGLEQLSEDEDYLVRQLARDNLKKMTHAESGI